VGRVAFAAINIHASAKKGEFRWIELALSVFILLVLIGILYPPYASVVAQQRRGPDGNSGEGARAGRAR
jgi:hypothetical protein